MRRFAAVLLVLPVLLGGCFAPVSGGESRGTAARATACTTDDIGSSTASWQGGVGKSVGVINLVNTSDAPCVLRGIPSVRLLRADGTALPVAQVRHGMPGAHRVDLVRPGGTAVSHVFWMNGCGLGGRAATVDVRWPGGTVPVAIAEGGSPRCDAPGRRSTVSVTGFLYDGQ
jgi:hypothetical protein